MAATAEAARLTEAHRQAQLRLGRATVAQLLAVWPLLDVENLDATTARWLVATVPIVAAARRLSARLAANYLATFRTMEIGVDAKALTPVVAETADPAVLRTSLLVTGPITVKQAVARGLDPRLALDRGAANAAGAGMRHALNGGRDTIHDTVQADDKALGYARVTSGHACAFCAMIASRGAVYKTAASAGDSHRYHDRCGCGIQPIYRRDAALPPSSDRYRAMWQQAKDEPGDTTKAFRRLVEA